MEAITPAYVYSIDYPSRDIHVNVTSSVYQGNSFLFCKPQNSLTKRIDCSVEGDWSLGRNTTSVCMVACVAQHSKAVLRADGLAVGLHLWMPRVGNGVWAGDGCTVTSEMHVCGHSTRFSPFSSFSSFHSFHSFLVGCFTRCSIRSYTGGCLLIDMISLSSFSPHPLQRVKAGASWQPWLYRLYAA